MINMKHKTKDLLLRTIKTLIFPACVFLLFAVLTKGQIFTSRMMMIILRQSVIPALIIMAMVPNLTLGMMDFSVGAVITLSAITGGILMNATNSGVPGLILFSLLTAVLLTSLTGLLNNLLRVPTLVLTLGLLLIYEALPNLLFPSTSGVAIIKVKYAVLAQPPLCFIAFGVAFVLFYIIINKTTYGNNIQALGGNEDLATRAGLNVKQIKQLGFTVSGLFAGIASAVYMANNGQVTPSSAFGSITVIMDAFLGLFLGMFLSNFCNISIGIVIAVITMTTMTNGLVALGFDSTWRDIIKSVVLFFLLAFSGNQPYFVRWRANLKRAAEANEEAAKAKTVPEAL